MLGVLSAVWLYRINLKAAVQEKLVSVASAAAAQIDADEHEEIFHRRDSQDEGYLRLVNNLHQILERTDGIKFIYTLRPLDPAAPETTAYAFVLDGGAKGRPLDFTAEEFSQLGDTYNSLPASGRGVLRTGRSAVDEDPIVDQWGMTMSGYAPIVASDGRVVGLLGVDMTEARLAATLTPVYWVAGGSLLFSLLIGLTISTVVGRWVLRPVTALTEGARRIMDGRFDQPVTVYGKDDLADALETFNEMMVSVKETQDAIRKQVHLDSQIEIAATVQKHFLQWPKLETSAINVKVDVKPADSTGGDWAQFYEVKDRFVYLLVGDVMGHGVGSAMMAAAVAGAFEVLKPQLELAPSVNWLLKQFGAVVHSAGRRELLMTMAIARLDLNTGDLEIASAGHPHPRIITLTPCDENPQNKRVRMIRTRGNPLGFNREEFHTLHHRLFPGEALVIVSDGVLERRDSEGRFFGITGFTRLLERTTSGNATDLAREIYDSAMAAGEYQHLDDDLSILVAAVPPKVQKDRKAG
jgi:serine phosphatase RsbU (regulator of sigma subunit)